MYDYSGAALLKSIASAEKGRRRVRVEQGRSPAQRTVRSENKARSAKRPNKGARARWKNEL